jgi:uncharacterized protein involved in tolerance to divalent cations
MENDWVVIFTTSKQYEAEIINGLLTENEVECVVVNKQDSAYLFGEYELFVNREDILKAKTLIQNIDL